MKGNTKLMKPLCVFNLLIIFTITNSYAGNNSDLMDLSSDAKQEAIRALLKHSAMEQYLSFYSDASRNQHLSRAGEALNLAYKWTKTDFSLRRDDSINKLISIVCSRLAWHLFQTKAGGFDLEDLLKESIKYDKGNAVAHYQLAMIYRSEKKPDSMMMAELEIALKIDQRFPEALLQLSMLNIRAKNLDKLKVLSMLYLDNLSYYKPELHFFDKRYPNEFGGVIITPPDEKYEYLIDEDGTLKNRIYHEGFQRFSLVNSSL